jgi:hypothetical protein
MSFDRNRVSFDQIQRQRGQANNLSQLTIVFSYVENIRSGDAVNQNAALAVTLMLHFANLMVSLGVL